MMEVGTIRTLLLYGQWANDRLIAAASQRPDGDLDKVFDVGRGTLRKTLLHILAGETVWLQRWQGRVDVPWPDEDARVSPSEMQRQFHSCARARDDFLATMVPGSLTAQIRYRDSLGGTFSASLADMMIQMCVHSTHHRAQAVNILRRLGADPPELDYMMWVRKPA